MSQEIRTTEEWKSKNIAVDRPVLAAGAQRLGRTEGSWFCVFRCDQKWNYQHRYSSFITSLTDIERFSYAVRQHYSIENQLHWALDAIFDEDASRARKDLSPLKLNILRKTALVLCKHADFGPRVSIQKKRLAAALDPDRFFGILFSKF